MQFSKTGQSNVYCKFLDLDVMLKLFLLTVHKQNIKFIKI